MNISFITDTPHTAACFAEFIEVLPYPRIPQKISLYEQLFGEKRSKPIQKKGIYVLATGDAALVLASKNIFFREFNPQKIDLYSPSRERTDLAQGIASMLGSHKINVAFTGVASLFDVEVHKALATHASNVQGISFYDSPDEYLPGYSEIAAQVMNVSKRVLFANIDFVNYSTPDSSTVVATFPKASEQSVNTESQQVSSLGYVYTDIASKIVEKREHSHWHAHQTIVDVLGLNRCFPQERGAIGGQYTILPYFPEETEEQQQKFESFLTLLKQASAEKDLSHLLILVQATPSTSERIQTAINSWKDSGNSQLPLMLVSRFDSEFSLLAADGMLYHSSPIAHQVALAGIPTIQIGSDTISDILVNKGIGSKATSAPEFIQSLTAKHTGNQLQILLDLGFSFFWSDSLRKVLYSCSTVKQPT